MNQTFEDALKYGFRISHTEEGWITPLAQALAGIEYQAAVWKPDEHTASIWELAAHSVNYTEALMFDLSGKETPDTEDWPPVEEANPDAWSAMQQRVRLASERLQSLVDGLDAASLSAPPPGRETTVALRLMELTVHDSYHAGQVIKLEQTYRAAEKGVAGAAVGV